MLRAATLRPAPRPAARTRRGRGRRRPIISASSRAKSIAPAQRASVAGRAGQGIAALGHAVEQQCQQPAHIAQQPQRLAQFARRACGGSTPASPSAASAAAVLALQHFRRATRLAQQQVLHGEFEVDQPAAAGCADPRATARGWPRRCAGACRRRRRPAGPGRAVGSASRAIAASIRSAQHRIAGDRPRPGQRHVLPGPGRFALISGEGRQARGDRPGCAGRPQPHIDLVEPALGGRRGDRRDQPLAEPRVIGRDRQRARAGRAGRVVRRRVVDQDQVEVGGERSSRGCRAGPSRRSRRRRPAPRRGPARNRPRRPAAAPATAVSAMSASAAPASLPSMPAAQQLATPTWKRRSLVQRRRRSSVSSKSRAPREHAARSAASPSRSGSAGGKLGRQHRVEQGRALRQIVRRAPAPRP